MKKHPLISFFVIAFVITWGLGAMIMIFHAQFEAAFGTIDMHKPFYKVLWHVAVYGPAISAFVIISFVHGVAGMKAYLRRFLHWRAGSGWYALVLVGVPAVHLCGRLVFSALGGTPPSYEFHPWYMVIPLSILALVNDPGPLEELGWRGFALPLLQRKFSALGASVILGIIWGIWHLPAFYISATPQSAFSFPLFLLGTVSYAIVITTMYNNTAGSIPLAFLFHWQINNAFGLSIYPKGEWISPVSFAVVALVMIIVFGPRNLGRAKYTHILSLEAEGETTS